MPEEYGEDDVKKNTEEEKEEQQQQQKQEEKEEEEREDQEKDGEEEKEEEEQREEQRKKGSEGEEEQVEDERDGDGDDVVVEIVLWDRAKRRWSLRNMRKELQEQTAEIGARYDGLWNEKAAEGLWEDGICPSSMSGVRMRSRWSGTSACG